MSTPLKWLVMLVLWFIFCVITFKACVQEACCDPCVTTEEPAPSPPAEPSIQRYPIDFQWDNPEAFTNEGYESLRDRLVNEMGPDNQLIITGKHFASEAAPEGYGSMGMARAERVKAMLAEFIPADRIIVTDMRLNDLESARANYFESVDLEWQAPDKEEEAEIIELENQIIIRFPFSSAVKDADPAVDEYLDKLAERLKQTDERVEIVGHADNVGTDDRNIQLSKQRAAYIRDILLRKGVSSDRLVVDWKGESDPRSSNDTEEGRHNNRRVELRILEN